jgi:putative tricarboxylic transport membrane protein
MRRLLADPDGRADVALALTTWLVAGLAFAGASMLPPPLFDPLGSAAVPKAVSAILAVLAAGVVARRWMLMKTAARTADPDHRPAPLRPGIAFASMAIVIAYVGAMGSGLLGFREATVPFVILLGGVMSRFRRGTMIVLVPLAFVMAIGLWWLFTGPLYVDLPVTRWLR